MEEQASILNPTVYLGSLEVREPVTSITDFMIAITCFIGFIYLIRNKQASETSFTLYRLYFLMFAIGMTSAAWFGHALQAYVSFEWKMIGWLFSLAGQTLLAYASLFSARAALSEKMHRSIFLIISLSFATFLVWILSPARSFGVAQMANGVFVIGLILPLQLYQYIHFKNNGNLIIMGALLYGTLPSLVFNQKISLSEWFNYHDISHLLLCGFMALMIFGVRKLELITVQRST
ncbi:MAG: hypothetical protein RLP15_04240 [Cryomorphaceae bacterium]